MCGWLFVPAFDGRSVSQALLVRLWEPICVCLDGMMMIRTMASRVQCGVTLTAASNTDTHARAYTARGTGSLKVAYL